MALVIPPAPGQSTMQRPVVEDYLIDRWRRNMLEGAGGTRPATARLPPGAMPPPPAPPQVANPQGMMTRTVLTFPNAPTIRGATLVAARHQLQAPTPPEHQEQQRYGQTGGVLQPAEHVLHAPDRSSMSMTSQAASVQPGSAGSFFAPKQQRDGAVLGLEGPIHNTLQQRQPGQAYGSTPPWATQQQQQQQQFGPDGRPVTPPKGLWSKVRNAFGKKSKMPQGTPANPGPHMATAADVEGLWQQQQQQHHAQMQQAWQQQQQSQGHGQVQGEQQWVQQQQQQQQLNQHPQHPQQHQQQQQQLQQQWQSQQRQQWQQQQHYWAPDQHPAQQGFQAMRSGHSFSHPGGPYPANSAGTAFPSQHQPYIAQQADSTALQAWGPQGGAGGWSLAAAGVAGQMGGAAGAPQGTVASMITPDQMQQQTLGPWYGHLKSAMQQQYLLSAPVVVPAPVLMDVVAQVQRSNELLRKESQARTVGMRNLVHAVNRNLAVTEHLVTASGGKLGAVPSIVGGRLAPSWQKVLDPTSLDHLRMQQQQQQPLARAWQEPVPAAQLVQSLRTLPGDKWDDTRDLRLGVWNVPGLRFRGSGDQDAITVVAQLLWAAGLDVVVLQGLAGPGAAAKVCALLNLWDASNGAECWKSSCSPNLLAASSAASYGLEAQVERQAHAPSHTAFLWREPHVLPWSASAAAAAEAEAHSQALRSGAGSRAAVTPGSNDFAVVEVGGGGGASVGAARLGQPEPPRGTFVGLLSVGNQPLLLVPVRASRDASRSRAPQQDTSQLMLGVEAASRRMQQHHPGLGGRLWTVLAGSFSFDPSSNLERAQWEVLAGGGGYGLQSEGSGADMQGGNICVSKNPSGSSTHNRVTANDRVVQPVSKEGLVGDKAQAPYRCGALPLKPALQALLPGSEPLVWGEVRVRDRQGLPSQVPASLQRQRQAALLRGRAASQHSHGHDGRGGELSAVGGGYGRGRQGEGFGLEVEERRRSGGFGLEADVDGAAGVPGRRTAGQWDEADRGFGLGLEVGAARGTSSRPGGGGGGGGYSKVSTPDGPRTPGDTSPTSRPGSRPLSGTGAGKSFGLGEELRSPSPQKPSFGLSSEVGTKPTAGAVGSAGKSGFGLGEDLGLRKSSGGTGGLSKATPGLGLGAGAGAGAAKSGGYGLGQEVRTPSPTSPAGAGLSGKSTIRTGSASVSGPGLGASKGGYGLGEELDTSPRASTPSSGVRASTSSISKVGTSGGGGGGGFGLGAEMKGPAPKPASAVSSSGGLGRTGTSSSVSAAKGSLSGAGAKPASKSYGLDAEDDVF